MTLKIPVSDDIEAKLRAKAAAVGQDIETYFSGVLARAVQRPISIHEFSGPIAKEFERSGLTDDDLSDLLEQTKYESRRRRHEQSQ